ncbi:MAG: glycosyltransferase WbsX family protein [Candidatus Binatia bacterium]
MRKAPASGAVRSSFITAAKTSPRLVAFYLPQYHRVKENDEWWGEGFTEWTNVRKTHPNFEDHYQPHVPENEDYYDLSDVNVQIKQARLAKEYGITAFCYYMYWFSGRRLLEGPLDRLLATPAVDIEFCVCWANENWTRMWDGKANDILLAQHHSPENDRRFIRDAMKYLADPRYLRVDGKLMVLVYRVDLIPNCADSMAIWREEVRRAGLGELHLCAVQFYGITDPEPWGFDAAVEFPPHGWLVHENLLDVPPKLLNERFAGHIFDYTKSVDFALRKPIPDYRWYRGVFPGWDNTARRQDTPHIFAYNDPFQFQRWLTEVLLQTALMAPPEHQIVFINAWNEWGEGAHLEPDAKTGRLNLMAAHAALGQIQHEDSVINILGRLRKAGPYPERDQDERALLNYLRGQEQSLRELSWRLQNLSGRQS